ncbi:MAG: phosphoribosylanthranilate isomerase [Pseudomonadota bacterium]
MRTRVKICGITRREDALAAARLGADAIGLVFYPRSPRAVTPTQAAAIVQELPAFVTVVGLFVNAAPAEVRAVLEQVRIDMLQFHGEESAAQCRVYRRPYLKAVAMRADVDLRACARDYADSAALLLDTHQPGVPGGTGQAFDWSRVPENLDKPIILAGGLNADNVAAAIRQVRPYAVDVSGGVESAKGVKDHEKIAAFVRSVMNVSN